MNRLSWILAQRPPFHFSQCEMNSARDGLQRGLRVLAILKAVLVVRFRIVTFRASCPLGVAFGFGGRLMSQNDNARINELCTLIGQEKDSAKVLWLTEELNRLL